MTQSREIVLRTAFLGALLVGATALAFRQLAPAYTPAPGEDREMDLTALTAEDLIFLRETLLGADEPARRSALRALYASGDPRAVAILLDGAREWSAGSDACCWAALEILRTQGPGPAREALERAQARPLPPACAAEVQDRLALLDPRP